MNPRNPPFLTLEIMTPTLCITRWSETFENADTRKRERLKSFHAPSGCESRGYLTLVSRFPQDKAMMAFGVFQALCQLSATLGKSIRGRFENTDRAPMDLQQLACLLRIEVCHLVAALEILTDSKVRWCFWSGDSVNLPIICHTPPGFVQGEVEGEVEGESEERTHTLKSSPSAQEPPAEAWSDRMPTDAARDYTALQTRINSLHPKWKARPHFTRIQMDELQANARIFFDLTERDWALLTQFMDVSIDPEWEIKPKPWQPDQRGQLVASVLDVLGHADRWERECRKRKVPTGLEVVGGVA